MANPLYCQDIRISSGLGMFSGFKVFIERMVDSGDEVKEPLYETICSVWQSDIAACDANERNSEIERIQVLCARWIMFEGGYEVIEEYTKESFFGTYPIVERFEKWLEKLNNLNPDEEKQLRSIPTFGMF